LAEVETGVNCTLPEGNKIQLFEKEALGKLPETLRYLSVGDNSFSYGDYFLDLYHLPIHFINLSNLLEVVGQI
jgi:hypothetical protein